MLLLSSITYGFAMLGAHRQQRGVLAWLARDLSARSCVSRLELREFSHLIAEGAGPSRSAFLSSFFTLVGTHGLHVTLGLVWMVVLAVQIICDVRTLSEREITRLTCLSLFWHFLDIVWICVFSFVYLGERDLNGLIRNHTRAGTGHGSLGGYVDGLRSLGHPDRGGLRPCHERRV